MAQDSPILAEVTPSAPRRVLAVLVLAGLSGVLIFLGLAHPPAGLVWQIFLFGGGIYALWLTEQLRRATRTGLILTPDRLEEAGGRLVVRVDEIVAVERGAFAFKPSNGFVLKATQAGRAVWRPGLWWRIGRRVGVGGATPARQTRAMAEVIAVLIAKRLAQEEGRHSAAPR